MINPKILINFPLSLEDPKDVYVYPPSVEDVLGNQYFHIWHQILTISQEEIEDQFVEKKIDLSKIISPIEYLFQYISADDYAEQLFREGFKFFLHEEVFFMKDKRMILIGNPKKELAKVKNALELRIIKEDNYFAFQNKIRESLGEKILEPPNPNEHPRIKQMKAKARYRDKIKAKKGNGLDLGTILVSICCMGIGLTPLNIGKISYASIQPLMRTYQEHEKYDIGVRSLQAGAKQKDVNLKYWIRKLDD